MFYWDRVNRLLEQTQRRAYGCAPLVLRRVGAKKKFFARRVSPNKTSETRPTRLNVRSICSNHNTYIYFSVPPPPIQYRRAILYNTYTIYALAGGKPAISLFIHPPSKSLSSTTFKGLLSTRGDSAGARHLLYRYGVRFYRLYSLNRPIRIFHPRDGKSLLAHLPLVP